MITKNVLSLAEAKAAAAAASEVAQANGWKVVVAIFDDAGNLQYLERADGAQVGSIRTAQEKGRTALLYKRPTKALEEAILGGRTVLLSMPGATPIEGGLPLVYGGEIVGAVGVSGVTSAQDGQVAQAAVDYISGLA